MSKFAGPLECTTLMLLDRDLRQAAHALVHLCGPCRKWHASQCCVNRSADESAEWWTEQACGGWLVQLHDTIRVVSDWQFWSDVCVDSQFRGGGECSVGHPLVIKQQEFVHHCMDLV
eukprot:2918160-Amphidinium_carterae.1